MDTEVSHRSVLPSRIRGILKYSIYVARLLLAVAGLLLRMPMLLHDAFIRSAQSHPRKLFISDRSLGKRVTFRKALISVFALSRKLRLGRGSDESRCLGIMLPNSAGSVLAVLAGLVAGRVPVMINYATGAERNAAFAMRRCNLSTVITSERFLKKLECPRLDGMIYLEEIVAGLSRGDKLRAAARALVPRVLSGTSVSGQGENDAAAIVFTSGSEGDPKPVVLSHRNIEFEIDAMADVFGLKQSDSMLANLPFFHVFGLTVNLFIPATRGLTMATHVTPLDYSAICRTIREEGLTIAASTPAFWWGYLRASRVGDFETLRIAVVGADKCPDSLREECLELHGVVLREGYGATETSPVISVNLDGADRPGSVGRPLPGVTVRIENIETGDDCAPGVTGRVLVSGELVMKEYLDDPEATNRAVRAGWYDTGDLGYIDEDGFLWLAGRLTRCVKVAGEMVSLWRVEEILTRSLPPGGECCVVAVPDERRGSRIAAVVSCPVDERTVAKQMATELPRVAVPKTFIAVDELPKLGSSKVDFRAAARLAAEAIKETR